MIRALGLALLLAAALHFVLVLGAVGWLWGSGRIDQQRFDRVVELFWLTVEQEQQELLAAEDQEDAKNRQPTPKIEEIGESLLTLQGRLQVEDQKNEVARLKVERLQRETGDIQRNVEDALRRISDQNAKLDQRRQDFIEFVDAQSKQMRDESFVHAVQMLEQLPPRQGKKVFGHLLTTGQDQQVVDYLAAMSLRKAAKILKEFKQDQEISHATELIEMLRQRGIYPLAEAGKGLVSR